MRFRTWRSGTESGDVCLHGKPQTDTQTKPCVLFLQTGKKKRKVWIWLIPFWLVPTDKVFQTTLEMHWTRAPLTSMKRSHRFWLALPETLQWGRRIDPRVCALAPPLQPCLNYVWPGVLFFTRLNEIHHCAGVVLEGTQQSGLHCVRIQEASPAGC